jgi:hypothetical protein
MVRVKPRRVAFIAVCAGLLAAGLYAAAPGGLADVRYYNARAILTAAAQAKRLPEAAELASAQSSLLAGHELEPANPLFVEQLARVYEMQALRLPRGDPAARGLLRGALEEFRAAALMRPGSPYVWAAIAALKLRLDELDFEFYGALDRASRYGRREPAVQLALADIGLAAWSLLAHPAKLRVLDAIALALPREGAEVRRLTAAHGTLPLVCDEAPRLRPGGVGLCVRN